MFSATQKELVYVNACSLIRQTWKVVGFWGIRGGGEIFINILLNFSIIIVSHIRLEFLLSSKQISYISERILKNPRFAV